MVWYNRETGAVCTIANGGYCLGEIESIKTWCKTPAQWEEDMLQRGQPVIMESTLERMMGSLHSDDWEKITQWPEL